MRITVKCNTKSIQASIRKLQRDIEKAAEKSIKEIRRRGQAKAAREKF